MALLLCLEPRPSNASFTLEDWHALGVLSGAQTFPCKRGGAYDPDPSGTARRRLIGAIVALTCGAILAATLLARAVWNAAAGGGVGGESGSSSTPGGSVYAPSPTAARRASADGSALLTDPLLPAQQV